MAAPWFAEILDHVDRRLLAGGYSGVSVDTAAVRRWLDALHWPYSHPERPPTAPADVEHTAQRIITLARRRSVFLAAAAGLAGPWALPPEVAGTAVATLRLGQRLAVVYGFDPETDRGRMALWRALAGALELPPEGPVRQVFGGSPQLPEGTDADITASYWRLERAASTASGR